ncbi:MAG: Maf family protein [Coriobacteriia bacterium]
MNPDEPAVVLASASPRRRRLIGWLGLDVAVTSVETAEDLAVPLVPAALTAAIAAEKALEVPADGRLVLAFDTIVVLDDKVLGKPADETDARRMLRALSGRAHEVVTGVALCEPDSNDIRTFSVTTRVDMHALSHDEIDAWIAQGECLGCAGAYNIERHLASVGVDECFQNVAGLPLCHVYAALAEGDVRGLPEGLTRPVEACDATLGRTCALGPRVCER